MKRAAIVVAIAFVASCNSAPSLTPEQRAMLADYILDSPPKMLTAKYDFDHKVEIVGVMQTPQMKYPPGTSLTVSVVWHAVAKVDAGYQLFAHLIGPTGELVQNIDDAGPLRKMEGVTGQPLPPSQWETGKYYKDDLTFTIPEGSPVEVKLAVGVFKGATRMQVNDGREKDGQAVVLRFPTGGSDRSAVIKELEPMKLAPGTAIKIDGRLDEPAWIAAPSTGPFVNVGNGRADPMIPSQGSARLLWDEGYLYAGIEVLEKHVRGGWPKDAKDPHLWEKDTAEIMIDPDGDGDNKDYYEIQINPQNLVFDTQYDDYNSPNGGGKGPFGHEEWTANLTSAVEIHGTIDNDSDQDHGYTVEAKIPWASFTKAKHAPPSPGDTWRMNFYAMKDNGGTSWSPILGTGNFHRASRFGRVRWKSADTVAPPPSADR